MPVGLLVTLHLLLALAILGLAAAALALLLAAAARGVPPARLLFIFQRALGPALVAAAVLGLLLLLVGRRPREQVHLVYAVVAILVVPGMRRLAAARPASARLFQLAAMAFLLGVLIRLLTTG